MYEYRSPGLQFKFSVFNSARPFRVMQRYLSPLPTSLSPLPPLPFPPHTARIIRWNGTPYMYVHCTVVSRMIYLRRVEFVKLQNAVRGLIPTFLTVTLRGDRAHCALPDNLRLKITKERAINGKGLVRWWTVKCLVHHNLLCAFLWHFFVPVLLLCDTRTKNTSQTCDVNAKATTVGISAAAGHDDNWTN